MTAYAVRTARADDYDAIAAVIDDWWQRPILPLLPRLFLDHFHQSSLIAEGAGGLTGFLVGIISPSVADEAYIHFVGVSPVARNKGIASALYNRFFAIARHHDRRVVKAITSPVNTASIAFHRRLGFTVSPPRTDYNGPGTSMVTFERLLDATASGQASQAVL